MSPLHAAVRRAQGKRVTVGFDGFIDTIARPVRRTASAAAPAEHFPTIPDFGRYLAEHGGKSCSVALTVERRQLGGNLPHLSRAAGTLGLDVSCVGMLGDPAIDPVFRDMPCRLYSFAPAGQATALEFADGKVFLATDVPCPPDPWAYVTARVPEAPALFRDADPIALVNWSELDLSQPLWEAVFEQVLRPGPADPGRYAFFDLCDCTRRTSDELGRVLTLIGAFGQKRTAVLSLNENEALDCGRKLVSGTSCLPEIMQALRARYGMQEVLVHTLHETLLQTPRGLTRMPTQFVPQPKISTGAGDHFNGASCLALLAGLPDADRVRFAGAFASAYVRTGRTPTLDETLDTL